MGEGGGEVIGTRERSEKLICVSFSRWIVNELTFCGNANLSRNTTDGIDYASCPKQNRKNCDYNTPFWGQASSIVS